MARKGNTKEESKTRKNKSEKKGKDPNAPKRPLGAFFRFAGTAREEVKQQNPDAGIGEIGKILGALWKELPDARKRVFQEETDKEMEVWRQELEDYKASKKDEHGTDSEVKVKAPKGKKQKTN